MGIVVAAVGAIGCAVYDSVPMDPSGAGGAAGAGAITSAGMAGEGAGEVSDAAGGGAGGTSGGDPVVAIDAGATDRGEPLPDVSDAAMSDDKSEDARTVDAAPKLDSSTIVPNDDAPSDATGECARETRSAFCIRVAKNCGPVTGIDNCGVSINVDCGICVPLEACAGTGIANICGAPPNLAQGGTVTSSNVGTTPEEMTKAFDGDGLTKWFASGTKTPWIAYQFAEPGTHVVTSYGVASANDFPVRDPSAWQLQGSNDGTTWITLDTRMGQTFANRFQTNIYPCANATAYPRYRFLVTANSGSPDTQVAEIMLFGN